MGRPGYSLGKRGQDMTTEQRLAAAHTAAQRAFGAMMRTRSFSDPDAPETKAYVAAERLVDSILVDAQWEKAKAELDRLQMADLEEMGDHFRYERVDV